jgi:hypothetical protein
VAVPQVSAAAGPNCEFTRDEACPGCIKLAATVSSSTSDKPSDARTGFERRLKIDFAFIITYSVFAECLHKARKLAKGRT